MAAFAEKFPEWIGWVGVGMAGLYLGASIYGELHRQESAFWRAWTDVSGLRFLGLNQDGRE